MASPSRPLSPHLQVYRPQITTVLSISHRITGVFMALGLVALAWWLLRLAAGQASFDDANALLASPLGLLFLAAVTFSFMFHLCNGVRHLFWDAGVGVTREANSPSGWAVIVSTVVLSAALWAIGLGAFL